MIPTKIRLDAGNGTLAIRWSDGHESRYTYQYLRNLCPCATCTGREGKGAEPAVKTGLPMFQKALRPERAEVVGRYAVQLFWSDGHSTGIYTFPYLRNLCECEHCSRQRAGKS